MTKAFDYPRVSGKGQLQRDGFPRQQLVIDTYGRGNKISESGALVRNFGG
jgi:hypothetical protein